MRSAPYKSPRGFPARARAPRIRENAHTADGSGDWVAFTEFARERRGMLILESRRFGAIYSIAPPTLAAPSLLLYLFPRRTTVGLASLASTVCARSPLAALQTLPLLRFIRNYRDDGSECEIREHCATRRNREGNRALFFLCVFDRSRPKDVGRSPEKGVSSLNEFSPAARARDIQCAARREKFGRPPAAR